MATYEDCSTVIEVNARRDRIRESIGFNINNEMEAQLRLLEISNDIRRIEQDNYDVLSLESVDSDATIIYDYDPEQDYISDATPSLDDTAIAGSSQVRFKLHH